MPIADDTQQTATDRKVDALADVLFALVGDLRLSGAIDEWKASELWKTIDEIRGTE